MAEFLLETKATEPVSYQVHNINCSAVENKEQQRYLGSYANAEAPFRKAVNMFSGVDCCPDCISH